MNKRLGMFVYDTPNGLGYQAKSIAKHLKPDKLLNIDITKLNGMKKMGWYPGVPVAEGYPSEQAINEFLQDLDLVLVVETPLNYYLFQRARELGVKSVQIPNWEFLDYFVKPDLAFPDLIISPSMWHFSELKNLSEARGAKCVYIHHPVDREEFPFRLRSISKFLHVAGKPAVHDRNGTQDFLFSVPNGTVVIQSEEHAKRLRMMFRNSSIHSNVDDPSFIYQLGDVLVMPRKYGGNCLPVNEALSCGLPVIMTDVSPNNHLLPEEWLVEAYLSERFTPRTTVDIYSVKKEALDEKIEYFRNCDIREESKKADKIANSISWETLKPVWEQELLSLF